MNTCNCITDVAQKLTELMIEKNPGAEIVESVTFENISWLFTDNGTMEVLNNPVKGKYSIKGKVKKWNISMMPTYCPFCGKKLKKEEKLGRAEDKTDSCPAPNE